MNKPTDYLDTLDRIHLWIHSEDDSLPEDLQTEALAHLIRKLGQERDAALEENRILRNDADDAKEETRLLCRKWKEEADQLRALLKDWEALKGVPVDLAEEYQRLVVLGEPDE